MLTYELISQNNLQEAIMVQKTIFSDENGSQDLIDSMNSAPPSHQFLQRHWLVRENNQPVGIVGLYAYKDYPEDAWLGWYGILEVFRGKGYGRKIFNFAKEQALLLNFKNLRLYTDEEDNFIATKLYEKLGMEKEFYILNDGRKNNKNFANINSCYNKKKFNLRIYKTPELEKFIHIKNLTIQVDR